MATKNAQKSKEMTLLSEKVDLNSETDSAHRPTTISGLLANRPLIICILYLCTYFTGFSCAVGVVLAYVFKNGPTEDWEVSQYLYLIRTFWILVVAIVTALTGGIVLTALTESIIFAVLFGLLFFAVLIQVAARMVYAMLYAAQQKPMPQPTTFLV